MPTRQCMLLDEIHRRDVANDAEVEALDEVQELAGQRDLLRGGDVFSALCRPILDEPCAELLGLLEQQRQTIPCPLGSHEVVLGWSRKRLLVNVVAELPQLEDDLVWL